MSEAGPVDDVGLTELQLLIMQTLWAESDATVSDVVKALSKDRPLAHTTVSTMLTRLERRGIVRCDRSGRQLVYSANMGRPEARRALVSSLVNRVFGGDVSGLVAHLIHDHDLAQDELAEMTRLVEEGKAK